MDQNILYGRSYKEALESLAHSFNVGASISFGDKGRQGQLSDIFIMKKALDIPLLQIQSYVLFVSFYNGISNQTFIRD